MQCENNSLNEANVLNMCNKLTKINDDVLTNDELFGAPNNQIVPPGPNE